MGDTILRRTTVLERRFPASLDAAWDLWTTAAGFESWWGPDGFSVTVKAIDLRVGGTLLYAMTATAPEQIAFLKGAGMPLTSETPLTFLEVVPKRRLAFSQLADFIPDATPYDVSTWVELHEEADGVRMVVTVEAMHDEMWTGMALAGWESQLDKLVARFAARAS